MPALWEGTYENLAQVDPTKLDVSKRKLVYLPGRGQTDSATTELSKGVHFMEKLVADLEPADRPHVYIWSHADSYNKKITGDVRSMSHLWSVTHLPGYSSEAAEKLARELIMPMVTDEKGKALSFKEAQKNLIALTLVGYCLGSTTAQEMRRASIKMMTRAGYNGNDAKALFSGIPLIDFADMTDKDRNGYAAVIFQHSDDFFIGLKNIVVRPLSSLLKVTENLAANMTGHLTSIFASASEKLTIKEQDSNTIIVSGAARNNLYRSALSKLGRLKTDGVKLRNWKLDANHGAKTYVTDDERNLFAQMAKCAILNAVTRDRPVRPLTLLTQPSFLGKDTPEATEQYNKTLVTGLRRGAPRGGAWARYLY